jgi:hypothetical protein
LEQQLASVIPKEKLCSLVPLPTWPGFTSRGACVAHRCQILIAFWDGRPASDGDDTARIVHWHREGLPATEAPTIVSSLDLPEVGPVWHISTPRTASEPGTGAGKIRRLFSQRSPEGWWSRHWRGVLFTLALLATLGMAAAWAWLIPQQTWALCAPGALGVVSVGLGVWLRWRRWHAKYIRGHAGYFKHLNRFNSDVRRQGGLLARCLRWLGWLSRWLPLVLAVLLVLGARTFPFPEKDRAFYGTCFVTGAALCLLYYCWQLRKRWIRKSTTDTLPPEQLEKLPRPLFQSVNRDLFIFNKADSFAQELQRWTRAMLWWILVFSFLAAFFKWLVAQQGPSWAEPLPVCFLSLAGLLWGLWWLTDQGRRFQDYRALAEGLRVQHFWRLLEPGECPAAWYPRTLRQDMGWVRLALQNLYLVNNPEAPVSPGKLLADPAWLRLIHQYWVSGQYRYFKKAAPRNARQHYWALCGRWTCLVVGGLSLLGLLCGVWLQPADPDWQRRVAEWLLAPGWLKDYLPEAWTSEGILRQRATDLLSLLDVFCRYGLFILAGYFIAWSRTLSLSVHADRYRHMRDLYARMNEYLDQAAPDGVAADPRKVLDQLRELGREALGENARWLREQRKRDAEEPRT